MNHNIIHADHVWKSFGKHSIVEDISLSVDKGTVYGLVGLNGVGKTTLLRLFLGLITSNKGTIELFPGNVELKKDALFRRCGVILEHDGFWGNLTIMENLDFYAQAKRVSKTALFRYLDENWRDTGLLDIKKKVKYLSRGQKMQCSICRAFIGDPDILLLDEPVIALDLHANTHFCSMIKKAKQRGAAIIISSHQLELIDAVCDRVGVLKDKSLCEINRHSSIPWIIVTDDNHLWKTTIEACGAEVLQYKNGWIIDAESEVIPDCIIKLASLGCRIHGVSRVEGEFSSKIRTVYEIQKSESQDMK